MNRLKPTLVKGSAKNEREYRVLLGLVHYYLKTGKPVGSNTLKETGFEELSSATIRNYFAHLEQEGYLSQQHSSGGRVPTHLAFRAYAKEYAQGSDFELPTQIKESLDALRQTETREIASLLQQAAEKLSVLTETAVFLSAPRFDHDYVVDLKLLPIDHNRCLCVIVTDFGMIQTEVLPTYTKMSAFSAKRIESYFRWRLTGHDKAENFEPEEEELAKKMYNELMVRYIVNYSNFVDAELYRTGFSKLLSYTEFHDPMVLANSLALFENTHTVRLLIKECCKVNQLKFWIGDDLESVAPSTPDCSVIAMPYYINQNVAGAIGMLSSTRVSYQELFGIIREFSQCISECLTRNLYKFKITFRQPQSGLYEIKKDGKHLLLLEDKGA